MDTRRFFARLVVAGFAFAPFVAPAQPAQSPVPLPNGVQFVTSVEGIQEYRLQNGLRVLLFPDPSKSNITVNITYMVGSRHEDYGETGMAHLLEHLLFKGSTNHPDIPKELKDHGSRPNGTTSFDRTNYYETFRATDENLQWALELEADRMVNSFVAKKDLDSEMTVVRNEYEAGENSPQRVLSQRVSATAFLWHNYGKTTIGARSDIERVPIDRLQAFYRHFYQPDNAVLVVGGKFDEAKTLALIDKIYSPIPKPTRQLRRTYTSEPVQDGERSVTLRRVGDIQATMMAHHIPAGPDPEFAAVQIASMILGDSPSGRLYKALVTPGKAVNVGAGVYQNMDPGLLFTFASVRTEKPLEDAVEGMLATFDEIKSNPFTDEEVNRARSQWLKGFELSLNDSEQVALGLTNWQSQGDWRLLFLHRDRIRKVTAEEVQKAALKYFVPSNRTVGRFLPEKNPVRAEVPDAPDVAAMVKDYKGDPLVARGEAFDASPENIHQRTQRVDLPGGLRLSLLPKKTRGAQVHGMISLRFGNLEALQGLNVPASAAGQLLQRGTQRHTREQLKDAFDRLKAQVAISGGLSGANARITTTRENLKAVLDLVGEVLREASFPENEFQQLRQEQLARLEDQKSDPQSLAYLAMARHLNPYPKGDPRATPTLQEQLEDWKSVTLDQVKAFYAGFYGASHGEATFIGDFEPADVQQQLTTLLGDWKSPKPYARIENRFQKITPETLAIETPDKANATWIGAIPLQMTDEHADYPAMVLSANIIGQGINSRFFARVRGKEGLSYGVSGSFNAPTKDDDGGFIASAICAPQNAPKVEASIKDELTKILENGFTPEEVEAAKKSWLQSRQVARAEDPQLTGRLTNLRRWERTMAFDAELEKKIMALTPADMQAALRRHLDLAQFNFYRAGDFKKANVTW
jgi:zinc protease